MNWWHSQAYYTETVLYEYRYTTKNKSVNSFLNYLIYIIYLSIQTQKILNLFISKKKYLLLFKFISYKSSKWYLSLWNLIGWMYANQPKHIESKTDNKNKPKQRKLCKMNTIFIVIKFLCYFRALKHLTLK